MKKFLPLAALFSLLILPQSANAGLSEGCYPIVECNAGQDYYGGSCQAHIETLANCPQGGPSQAAAFSCTAGCYLRNTGSGGVVDPCPGGVIVNNECLITLDVVDDTNDTYGTGNGGYKVWDSNALSEIVHLDNTGCADGQMAIADAAEATGWKCADVTNALDAVIQGLIDVVEAMLIDMGVDTTVRNTIITALENLLAGTNIAANQASLAGALTNLISPSTAWVGYTPTAYNGLRSASNGYATADGYCNSVQTGAKVCTVEEILLLNRAGRLPASIGGDEQAWINGGPPGFNSAANDCKGWTSNDTTALNAWGRYWNFSTKAGWADGCNLTHRFACCR